MVPTHIQVMVRLAGVWQIVRLPCCRHGTDTPQCSAGRSLQQIDIGRVYPKDGHKAKAGYRDIAIFQQGVLLPNLLKSTQPIRHLKNPRTQ